MSAETATRERVVLGKLKGAERARAEEALRRASGPWYLELLEAQTAHLRPVDSKRPRSGDRHMRFAVLPDGFGR
ncbi:MAG TPA: hypothetical protein VN820_01075 [Acidimicrobiales bacterium]|nr:hypothetical protein [Acidimicrobiales bacterium]